MGSAAMDVFGDIAVGYSVSGHRIFPSIRYASRSPYDPPGTLSDERSMVVGRGSQTNATSRWGDYSDLTVDPSDDCTFWYTQEYYTVTSDASWATRIGSFKFPRCGTTPTTWLPIIVK
ncbi:MAG: hypothetical protein H0X37_05025 [Herpetosiphonaceae bacterium]|nr:hypothetical protein [Herpetosiphonaceae bacterium]